MARYEVHATKRTQIEGGEVNPGAPIAEIDTDLTPSAIRWLLAFGGCRLVATTAGSVKPTGRVTASTVDRKPKRQPEPAAEPEPDSSPPVPAEPFAEYSPKIRDALAAAGIVTLEQAAIYIRDNGTLEPLEGIGRATNARIVAQLDAAGLTTT